MLLHRLRSLLPRKDSRRKASFFRIESRMLARSASSNSFPISRSSRIFGSTLGSNPRWKVSEISRCFAWRSGDSLNGPPACYLGEHLSNPSSQPTSLRLKGCFAFSASRARLEYIITFFLSVPQFPLSLSSPPLIADPTVLRKFSISPNLYSLKRELKTQLCLSSWWLSIYFLAPAPSESSFSSTTYCRKTCV